MVITMSEENNRYNALNGLRMLAAFGIVMMHVKANSVYNISGWIYNTCIDSFTNFVFLFMVISSFGMCCGYYDKIINNKISITDFYAKRFRKILPFFTILVLIDLIVSPSVDALYETFADITLLFGFLPDCGDISVIGVGWFIGLIFVFYIAFPFFCTLFTSKKKAWTAFAISLMYNYACLHYFNVGRNNILFSACFFIAGGLLYLYREQIAHINRWIMLAVTAVSIVLYYIILYYILNGNVAGCLIVSSTLVMYAILSNGGLLDNKVAAFFSGISMEIYLSHMFIFRMIEKIKLNYIFGYSWGGYISTVVLVLIGTTAFSVVVKHILKYMNKIVWNKKLGGECNGR